jgi:hypothetical protein
VCAVQPGRGAVRLWLGGRNAQVVADGGREDLRPVEVRGFCDERSGHPPAQARGSGQLGAKPNVRVPVNWRSTIHT